VKLYILKVYEDDNNSNPIPEVDRVHIFNFMRKSGKQYMEDRDQAFIFNFMRKSGKQYMEDRDQALIFNIMRKSLL